MMSDFQRVDFFALKKGKGRYHAMSQKGYISAIWGADHIAPWQG